MKFKYAFIWLLILFKSISSGHGDEVKCTLPEKFVEPLTTFVINKSLNCSANIFIHSLQKISNQAKNDMKGKQQSDPNAMGRRAYELMAENFGSGGPAITSEDTEIASKTGDHKIPLRHYKGTKTNALILFVHGGGWSRGNLKTHDQLCRKLCEATGFSVYAVDYRLAPENPYPAGIDDVESALEWVMGVKEKGAKILISGDSGGGNISAGLILRRIDKKKEGPDAAVLFYPALDLRIPDTTENPYATGYLLTSASINGYVKNYLGDRYKELCDTPEVSPLLALDDALRQFPPTIIINAECDPLADEGKEFVDKLKRLGVKDVERQVIPATIHIFAQFFDLFPEATDSMNFVKEFVERQTQ